MDPDEPIEFKCTEENQERLLELKKCAEEQQAKSYKESNDSLEEQKIYYNYEFEKKLKFFEKYLSQMDTKEPEKIKLIVKFKRYLKHRHDKYEKLFEDFEIFLKEQYKSTSTPPKIILPEFILYPWADKCIENDYIFVSSEKITPNQGAEDFLSIRPRKSRRTRRLPPEHQGAELKSRTKREHPTPGPPWTPQSAEGKPCTDFIKGWMRVHVRDFTDYVRDETGRLTHSTLKVAHVSYISTNQNKSKLRPTARIGRTMMNAMEKSMKSKGCHFVELMPLSGVVGFYKGLGYELEFKEIDYYTKWFTEKESFAKLLKLYESKLNKEEGEIQKRMEKEEITSFEPIFEKLSEEEQMQYKELQEKEEYTRMDLLFSYEDKKENVISNGGTEEEGEDVALKEIKDKLLFNVVFEQLSEEEKEEYEDLKQEDESIVMKLIEMYKTSGIDAVKEELHQFI